MLKWALSGTTLLALVLLLNGVYPEIFNRTIATQAYVKAGNTLIPPRYWVVGWIPAKQSY